eukprot:4496540-Prymnesium_polylepis.1
MARQPPLQGWLRPRAHHPYFWSLKALKRCNPNYFALDNTSASSAHGRTADPWPRIPSWQRQRRPHPLPQRAGHIPVYHCAASHFLKRSSTASCA